MKVNLADCPISTKMMKGIYLTGYGDYDKLVFRDDIPIPELTDTDVLVKVSTAGVNNVDINLRTKWYHKTGSPNKNGSWSGGPLKFPFIPGVDICGHIVAVGNKVNVNRIGARVLVEPCFIEYKSEMLDYACVFGADFNGGFAEYAVVPERHAFKINSDYSDIELASLPNCFATAENMLSRAGIGKNDKVLITGANGGVGSAAIQLAHAKGAKVIALCQADAYESVQALGAHKTISGYDNLVDVLGSESVDAVMDVVGGQHWSDYLVLLRKHGMLVVAGAIGGAVTDIDLRNLYLKDVSIIGCTIYQTNVFKNVIKYIENKQIKPVVAKVFPLKDIVEAQKFFNTKQFTGKIVLQVATD